MPGASCFGSIQACRIRVAELDINGSPATGADNGYVSDALIDVSYSPVKAEGDEFEQKNGCGDICQSFRDCDKLKRVDPTIQLCQLDSELIGMLTGATVFFRAGEALGLKMPRASEPCVNGVCLEVWSLAWDGASQAVSDPLYAPTEVLYWHWVTPKWRPLPGDFTLENGILTFPVEGPGEENPRITSNGPYNDWPAEVALTDGIDSPLGWYLDNSMPAAACAPITVTSAAS